LQAKLESEAGVVMINKRRKYIAMLPKPIKYSRVGGAGLRVLPSREATESITGHYYCSLAL